MQRKARDHRLGEASNPESVAHDTNQLPICFPVLAGQQICQGDIVTTRDGNIVRVESSEKSGDGINWGDVSSGAYVALESVNTMSARYGSELTRVFAPGARIVSILDANASLGSCMGVDFRTVEGDKRVDRKDGPVTWSTDHRLDSELWQRTRVMSDEDMRNSIRKKAFLGKLVEIHSSNDLNSTRSKQGDYGRIVIQSQP